MAIYHKGKSGYLSKKSKKYTLVLLVLICIVLLLSFLFSKIETKSLLVIAILFLLVALPMKLVKEFEKRSGKLHRGIFGEKDVGRVLKQLPDEFTVYEDVVIGNRGNTDFVVVAPTALFVIEVKSHRGSITFDGYSLFSRGRRFYKNFLNQVWGEKLGIENYLKSQGIHVKARPVLVFSKAWMNFGFNPLRGVVVINKDYLLNYIQSGSPDLNFPKEKIEEALNRVH